MVLSRQTIFNKHSGLSVYFWLRQELKESFYTSNRPAQVCLNHWIFNLSFSCPCLSQALLACFVGKMEPKIIRFCQSSFFRSEIQVKCCVRYLTPGRLSEIWQYSLSTFTSEQSISLPLKIVFCDKTLFAIVVKYPEFAVKSGTFCDFRF